MSHHDHHAHHAHHAHHDLVHSHHSLASESAHNFENLNRSSFIGLPHIHYEANGNVEVQFTIPEDTLKEVGLTFMSSHSHSYRAVHVISAAIGVQSQNAPDYHYFGSTFRKLYEDVLKTAALQPTLVAPLKIDLADYDEVTGFIEEPKLLRVRLSYI